MLLVGTSDQTKHIEQLLYLFESVGEGEVGEDGVGRTNFEQLHVAT